MGNSNAIDSSDADVPPDEIFQVSNASARTWHFLDSDTRTPYVQIKVANAGNSCYMDSVLFSMFAMPSPVLDAMLTKR